MPTRKPWTRHPARPVLNTPERREILLTALRQAYTVRAACAQAGVWPRTVYRWRSADRGFALEWVYATAEGTGLIALEAHRRAFTPRRIRRGNTTVTGPSPDKLLIRYHDAVFGELPLSIDPQDKVPATLPRARPVTARAKKTANGRAPKGTKTDGPPTLAAGPPGPGAAERRVLVIALMAAGATGRDAARAVGATLNDLRDWKRQDPRFAEACARALQLHDAERLAQQRALWRQRATAKKPVYVGRGGPRRTALLIPVTQASDNQLFDELKRRLKGQRGRPSPAWRAAEERAILEARAGLQRKRMEF